MPITTRSKRDPIKDFIPISKYKSLTLKTLNKKNKYIINNQCLQIGDKYYLVQIDPYYNMLLHDINPILENPVDFDDGIYMYVILSLDGSLPILYAIKVLSLYEFGTKHQQLIQRIACNESSCKKIQLYYAGEIMKNNDNLTFNFFSGTYKMKKKINKKELPTAIMFTTNLINNVTNNKYNTQFIDKPLLTNDILPLTHNDLNKLKEIGATIIEFNNKNDCTDFFYWSKRADIKSIISNREHDLYSKIKDTEQKYLQSSVYYGGKKTKKNKYKNKKTRKYKN